MTSRDINGRITVLAVCLAPVIPCACDLTWQTRNNEDIWSEVSVQKHILPLDASGRQFIKRSFWDIVHV